MYVAPVIYFYKFFPYIEFRGKDGQGEEVIKPYTPTTLDSDVGRFELVIKACLNFYLSV